MVVVKRLIGYLANRSRLKHNRILVYLTTLKIYHLLKQLKILQAIEGDIKPLFYLQIS